jgi:hypothetical protein
MKISFFLKSRALSDGFRALGLQFTFSRDNRAQKLTGLKVNPEFWDKDNQRVTKNHIGNEDINRNILDIQQRIGVARIKYDNKRLNSDGVVAYVLRKSDDTSVSNYINTHIKQDCNTMSTFNSYVQWWSAFKNMVGKSNQVFKIEDLMVERLYSNALKIGNKLVADEKLTSRSYKNYISVCQKVLNHSYDNRVIYDKYIIPKKFRTTNVFRKKDKSENQPYEIWNAIEKLSSIEQWQSIAIWLLSFSMRGFYYSDLVALTESKITDKKGKKTPRNLFGDMYIDHWREKSKVHIFIKVPRQVQRLLLMIKFSLVYTKIDKKINGKSILADINDRIGLYDYDKDTHSKEHDSLWKLVNRKSSKFGLVQKNARQTFNQYGQRIEVSKETREIMLGHLGNRTIEQHYDNYKLTEVVDRVDKAHLEVLEAFKTFELIKALTDKLDALIKANKSLPKWLLLQSGVHKVGREYKVLVGYENHKPIWSEIEPKYKSYFKQDISTDKGYWNDVDSWLDDKNRLHNAVKKNLQSNKWIKEIKKQQKELDESVKDVKVIKLNAAV